MNYLNMPRPIAVFFRAVKTNDTDAVHAIFARDIVLNDRGEEHCGDSATEWVRRGLLGSCFRPVNVARHAETTIVTMIVWADSLPDSLQLDGCFTIVDGKIAMLTIIHKPMPDLPAPVLGFIRAANAFDLDMVLKTFAADALVNDQLRDRCGIRAIREWAEHELIGDRTTIYVVRVVRQYGHVVVTANVDGNYDKRGLPDPLVLTFYFSIFRGKIIQLIILRNQKNI